MRALQYRAFGVRPEVVDVPVPDVAPGQILIKISAAGACGSDWTIMQTPPDLYRFGELPLTLGHEAVGVVAEIGAGVRQWAVGDNVAVYGPWGCGKCRNCVEGKENYCSVMAKSRSGAPGIGRAGAMAEYMLVDHERHLVSTDGMDPVQCVSLTDAGLTSYHAVKRAIPRLGAGSTALIIGCGGLGHVATQIVRHLTGATVVVADVATEKVDLGLKHGAHHGLIAGASSVNHLLELTAGRGVDVVFDFVGTQTSVDLAGAAVGMEGEISIVGIGGGVLGVGYKTTALDVSVRSPYWGSRSELMEVLDMGRRKELEVAVEEFSLTDAPDAYERLRRGQILGRAVVVP